MEKPKSFKESMEDIKAQFKEDQKHGNDKFKANLERNKFKNAEMKRKMNEKPNPKPKRKSSLDTSGGKNDVFNLFAQMTIGLILSIPIFLIGIFAIIFMAMLAWSFIFE